MIFCPHLGPDNEPLDMVFHIKSYAAGALPEEDGELGQSEEKDGEEEPECASSKPVATAHSHTEARIILLEKSPAYKAMVGRAGARACARVRV